MKKIKIPLTWFLGLVALMYFFVERNIRTKLFPEIKAPLGIELELDKGWDKLIFKRAKEVTLEKKEAVKKKKKEVLPVGTNRDDFIREWLICGPFPNPGGRRSGEDNKNYFRDSSGWVHGVRCSNWHTDFFRAMGGEISISPEKGMKVRWGAKKYKWDTLKSEKALIDFTKTFKEYEYVIAYSACYVYSDEEKDYLIKLGSDDGYKLWVNHNLVAELHVHRGSKPDQNSHQVRFHKGWNLILIKVCQDYGGFNFYLRLTDTEGDNANLPVRLLP